MTAEDDFKQGAGGCVRPAALDPDVIGQESDSHDGGIPARRLMFSSPQLFPVGSEGGVLSFLDLSESGYRAASFLDQRIVQDFDQVTKVAADIVSAQAPFESSANFIFHIGHCGSTLLSRLLGEHAGVFSLREPALLRELALGRLDPALSVDVLLALLSRVWRDQQTALIKATSFVSEVGGSLMKRTGGRALLLAVTPPIYLRTILAGPNSLQEARALKGERRARLERRLGRGVEARGDGECIALAWLCEASALQAIADDHPDASLQLDFDRGLADPVGCIERALGHLGLNPWTLDLRALVSGPMMARYSKGPEHAYDASLRAEVLAEAARDKAAEVRAGMDWLQRQAEVDPRVARVLTVAAATARPPLAARGPAG